MTASACTSAFVVTRSSRDHHLIIWTNQSPADVLQLSPCVSVKLIHVDRGDRKMSITPGLNTGVRDTKTANRSTLGDPSPSIFMVHSSNPVSIASLVCPCVHCSHTPLSSSHSLFISLLLTDLPLFFFHTTATHVSAVHTYTLLSPSHTSNRIFRCPHTYFSFFLTPFPMFPLFTHPSLFPSHTSLRVSYLHCHLTRTCLSSTHTFVSPTDTHLSPSAPS